MAMGETSDNPEPALADVRQSLVALIRQADRTGANALLDLCSSRHGYEQVFKLVLEPALYTIGESISGEKYALAQAYVAAKVAEGMLSKAISPFDGNSATGPAKGHAVLGNAEGDFHALGRRMVATMLRANGWVIDDLGNDVPANEFVDKALESGARIIGVSAMTMSAAQAIRDVRREIGMRGLSGRMQLAVGGAVFVVMPTLLDEVGGDGTAPSMFEAPRLFERLWQRSIAAAAVTA